LLDMTMGEWFADGIFNCFHSPGHLTTDYQRPVRIAKRLRDRTGINVSYATKEALLNDIQGVSYEEVARLYNEVSDCAAEESLEEIRCYRAENPQYRVIQA
jgi:hypothetical protein